MGVLSFSSNKRPLSVIREAKVAASDGQRLSYHSSDMSREVTPIKDKPLFGSNYSPSARPDSGVRVTSQPIPETVTLDSRSLEASTVASNGLAFEARTPEPDSPVHETPPTSDISVSETEAPVPEVPEPEPEPPYKDGMVSAMSNFMDKRLELDRPSVDILDAVSRSGFVPEDSLSLSSNRTPRWLKHPAVHTSTTQSNLLSDEKPAGMPGSWAQSPERALPRCQDGTNEGTRSRDSWNPCSMS